MKIFFRRMLTALLIVAALFTVTTCNAAVETFEGTGKYIMSEFETPEIARERAKHAALRNICEQVAFYFKAYCRSSDIELTDDEIAVIVNSVIIVDDVQINMEAVDINGEHLIEWTAKVKASIDTEAINKFIYRKDK